MKVEEKFFINLHEIILGEKWKSNMLHEKGEKLFSVLATVFDPRDYTFIDTFFAGNCDCVTRDQIDNLKCEQDLTIKSGIHNHRGDRGGEMERHGREG